MDCEFILIQSSFLSPLSLARTRMIIFSIQFPILTFCVLSVFHEKEPDLEGQSLHWAGVIQYLEWSFL